MRLRLLRSLSSIALTLIAAESLASANTSAQTTTTTAGPWPTVHQTNAWYGNIYEQPITPTFGFSTDIQLRRASLVEEPKQLLAMGGLSWRATQGVRFTLGGGYLSTTPNGLLPATYPTREYRIFYQLQLQQHAGPVDFSHRYRYENRWTHDVISDSAGEHNSATRFAHRFRYQLRATHPFSVKMHGQPVLAIAADEAFLGLTAVDRRVAFDQNRASVGIGIPIGKKERLEVSYMQQWIANSKLKASEINNTLLVVFVHNFPK